MIYKINPHQKRLPFGGHHFVERGATLKAETFWEVVDLLENYRLINGWPVGDPKQDVIDYYAKHFPWMVEIDFDAPPPVKPSQDYLDWREWITAIWGRPHGKFVSRKEASMRWEICKTCPYNVGRTWPSTKEAIEFDRKALLLRRGERTPENFCFCSLHRADISVGSFLESPGELSRKDENKQDHSGCWFTQFEGP